MEYIYDNLEIEIENVNTNLNNILIMNNGRDVTEDFDNDTVDVYFLLESSL